MMTIKEYKQYTPELPPSELLAPIVYVHNGKTGWEESNDKNLKSRYEFIKALNNTSVTAYDLEDLVKNKLRKENDQILLSLSFDCESSMFSVQSKKMEQLNLVNLILLNAYQSIVGVEQ